MCTVDRTAAAALRMAGVTDARDPGWHEKLPGGGITLCHRAAVQDTGVCCQVGLGLRV